MTGSMSRLAIGCVAAFGATLSLACAAPAVAQTTVYYGDSATLTVPVTATIGVSCGFASTDIPSGSYDAGAIDETAWQHDFTFTLQCTGPSRIGVVSSNGGLETSPDPSISGYTSLAPYTVALHVVRDGGTTDGSCLAADLEASSTATCDLRGTASDSVGLLVPSMSYDETGSYLRVSAPAYSGSDVLVTGSYSDTLTVTVSPAA